jgi:hypothetical protein
MPAQWPILGTPANRVPAACTWPTARAASSPRPDTGGQPVSVGTEGRSQPWAAAARGGFGQAVPYRVRWETGGEPDPDLGEETTSSPGEATMSRARPPSVYLIPPPYTSYLLRVPHTSLLRVPHTSSLPNLPYLTAPSEERRARPAAHFAHLTTTLVTGMPEMSMRKVCEARFVRTYSSDMATFVGPLPLSWGPPPLSWGRLSRCSCSAPRLPAGAWLPYALDGLISQPAAYPCRRPPGPAR